MRTTLLTGMLSFVLVSAAWAQWQVQPQEGRVEPVYPSKPYSFQTAPPNYDPFQFNWYTGQWDYVPIPYGSVQPPPVVHYAPYPAPPALPQWYPPTVQPQTGSQPIQEPDLDQPYADDSQLWQLPPTTQPSESAPPKIQRFAGRIVALRALNLMGAPRPHVIVRLRDAAGKTLTADLGDRLDIGDLPSGALGAKDVLVVGRMGEINNSPVMFADEIHFGSHTIQIRRPFAFPSSRPSAE